MNRTDLTLHIPSLEHLGQTAQQVAQQLPAGSVVAFYGHMGAGKTTFIKALCHQLGVRDTVNSPTFSIVNEHPLPDGQCVYHFDFYRIDDLREAIDMGYAEYFESGGLCLIEWPEKIESLLPENLVRVHLTENPDQSRTLVLHWPTNSQME